WDRSSPKARSAEERGNKGPSSTGKPYLAGRVPPPMGGGPTQSASRLETPQPIQRVLLDTNVLLLPFERAFPLARALAEWVPSDRIRVPTAVLGELEQLGRRGHAESAPALRLARTFHAARSRVGGDRGIIELARRTRSVVATADRQLRDELRRAGIGVLQPRAGVRLEYAPPEARDGLPLKEPRRSKQGSRRRSDR
ncbi:MAG TPA: hypothetical protein VGU43_02225, partial [Thermoplasmata archaeon]|nr:hypothetical protein [Thermoplasmata archaeon]